MMQFILIIQLDVRVLQAVKNAVIITMLMPIKHGPNFCQCQADRHLHLIFFLIINMSTGIQSFTCE
jgi:hypothetical protein